MQVKDLGEFGLINRIAGLLPSSPSDVVVGIGDDVAVLRTSGRDYLLATCDVQVENVHFFRKVISPYQLGRKLAAINISDIAAMGGSPCWALVSLALPPDTEVSYVDSLYQGIQEQIEAAGGAIVGGNVSKVKSDMVIDFFLLGTVSPQRLVLRKGAREGDLILVTGALGDSKAGLELVLHPQVVVSNECRQHVEQRHFTPRPRLREGQVLGSTGLVHAMTDVSDGLLGDLNHICQASRVGAEIWTEKIPVSSEACEVAQVLQQDGLSWALTGGEDYELLFTVGPDAAPEIQAILKSRVGTDAHVIGSILPQQMGIQLSFPNGTRTRLVNGAVGWDHFKR